MAPPKISVIMSAFNAEAYLELALDSVLGQSQRDFEFIVVDDASSDRTGDILHACADPRMVLLRNEQNLGLTRSLNIGLGHARGELIARMDADDVCDPKRFEIQAAFLDSQPDHILVGTSYRLIDGDGKELLINRKPMRDTELRWVFHLRTALEHASAMYRREIPGRSPLRYDERCRTAQDYDFWLRMLQHGKGRVLADVLLDYRTHEGSITATRSGEQSENLRAIALAHAVQSYALEPDEQSNVAELLRLYITRDAFSDNAFSCAVEGLLLLQERFIETRRLDPREATYIRNRAAGQLWNAVSQRSNLGFPRLARLATIGWRTLLPLLRRSLQRRRPL